jgi:broad specificity phosphatase PhoE
MSTLLLIRHGQASFGQGDYDKLSEKGARQSRITAEHLLDSGNAADVIFTGTMLRHRETCDQYLEALAQRGQAAPEIITTAGLNEYDSKEILTAIVPELVQEDAVWAERLNRIYTDKRSFQLLFESAMERWISGDYAARGIATWEEYLSWVNGAMDRIMTEHGRGKSVGVFTSGGTIAAFVKRALNLTDADALRVTWQIVNCSISRFKCTTTSLMMATFNEHAHLERCDEKHMVTYR